MNHESISQICFAQDFEVQEAQTAPAVFSGLPFGRPYAGQLAEVLSSAALLAELESICIGELRPHVDWERHCVLGKGMHLEHCGAAQVGQRVEATGFVCSLGERSVHFHVEARVGARTVARALLSFAVVDQVWPQRQAVPAEQVPVAERYAALCN